MVEVTKILSWVESHFELVSGDVAINGLQIENSGRVKNLVSAVDFSLELLQSKEIEKNTLFIVHNGLFWGKPFPLVGYKYRLLEKCLNLDSALLALHLPLDIHPKWGNNVTLSKRMGLHNLNQFGSYKGVKILLSGEYAIPLLFSELVERFKKKVGQPLSILPFGSKTVKKVGLCTGGGLFGLEEAKKMNCDTYITGDANHTSVLLCRELGINLISGGHYNTEKFGVQALGEELKKKFNISHRFVDLPSHL